jgi:hypothetical protein
MSNEVRYPNIMSAVDAFADRVAMSVDFIMKPTSFRRHIQFMIDKAVEVNNVHEMLNRKREEREGRGGGNEDVLNPSSLGLRWRKHIQTPSSTQSKSNIELHTQLAEMREMLSSLMSVYRASSNSRNAITQPMHSIIHEHTYSGRSRRSSLSPLTSTAPALDDNDAFTPSSLPAMSFSLPTPSHALSPSALATLSLPGHFDSIHDLIHIYEYGWPDYPHPFREWHRDVKRKFNQFSGKLVKIINLYLKTPEHEVDNVFFPNGKPLALNKIYRRHILNKFPPVDLK